MSVYNINKAKIREIIGNLQKKSGEFETESALTELSPQNMEGRVPDLIQDIVEEIRESRTQVVALFQNTIAFLTAFENNASDFDKQGASKLSAR